MQESAHLFIDRHGCFMPSLPSLFEREGVVVVSDTAPAKQKHIVHIPFGSPAPKLPNYVYKGIVIVWSHDIVAFLPEIIGKAKTDDVSCVLLLSIDDYTQTLKDTLFSFAGTVTVVVYGDVFGKTDEIRTRSLLTHYKHQAKEQGVLQVPGSGADLFFPTPLPHLFQTISTALRTRTSGIHFVFAQHAFTKLQVAHIAQRVLPTLTIDFTTNYDHHDFDSNLLTAGTYVLSATEVKQQLIAYCKTWNVSTLRRKKKMMHTTTFLRHTPHTAVQKTLFMSILFLVCVLAAPMGVLFFTAWMGGQAIQTAIVQAQRGNTADALKNAQAAKRLFRFSQQAGILILAQADIVGQKHAIAPIVTRVEVANELTQTLVTLLDAFRTFSHVVRGESKTPKQDFAAATTQVKQSILTLQKLQLEQQSPEVKQLSEKLAQTQGITTLMHVFLTTADVLPAVLGVDEKKTYLVLFQNNMELRPGGGFIGSYGLLTLTHGSIQSFTMHDVYDADGQLKGHIEPPFFLRRHLPSAHLYLRDSNYAVDFVKGASVSARMLQEETGERVDGVIGVDVSFVRSVVAALQSVYIPSYNQTVTKDNFYRLTQTHAEKDFFPGSTQKKDFLRSLFAAIQEKLADTKAPLPSPLLLDAVGQALAQKHLVVAFAHPSIQQVFSLSAASSTILDTRQDDYSHSNDFLGINEANIGVNKTNYFLKRKVTYHTTITPAGNLIGEVAIRYRNDGNTWPGGDYKQYLRFLLPKDAQLISVAVDGKTQTLVPAVTDFAQYESPRFKAPFGLEIEQADEYGKTIYGFLMVVPKNAYASVKVTYQLAKVLSLAEPTVVYSLRLFKQPGTEDDPYALTITYPTMYRVVKASQDGKETSGSFSSTTRLVQDSELTLQLGKK